MKRGSIINRLLDRYIGIPVLFSTLLIQRHRRRPEILSRIGVMTSPTLGDTLLSSAALEDLRSNFPKADIIYFASETSLAAAKLLPGISEIVKVELTSPFRAIRALRNSHLDVLLDFTPWQRLTAFYAAWSGARYRVGFRSQHQYRHWTYDRTTEHARTLHELDNYRELLRAFGVEPKAEPFLKLPPAPARSIDDREIIVFHPWASGERAILREWPTGRWVELAHLLAAAKTVFVVTGAPYEWAKSEALSANLKRAGLNARTYVSKDGLASLGALLRGSDLVVSVNTGIMHLAAIAGAPTIGLNGPTASHRWGPRGPRAVSVEPRGGGGFLHFGFEFGGHPTDCMRRIAVEDVYNTARELSLFRICEST